MTTKRLLTAFFTWSLAACATAPSSKPEKQDLLGWSSTRLVDKPAPTSCPASEKAYLRENSKNLIQYAWNCSLLEKWSQLGQIGDLLAQKLPQQPWGAFYLSVSALGKGENQRAIWMIDLALKKSPKMGLLHYQKGRIHWQMGEFGHAVTAFEKSVSLDRTLVDAHLILAQVYFREHNFKRAEQHFAAVLDRESGNPQALAGLAETKFKRGDIKDSVALFERAVNASPRSVALRLRLAGLYETEMRDLPQALSVYKRIDTLLGDNRVVQNEKVPFDIKAKIRDLEATIEKASPGRKITTVDRKARVKK